MFTNPGAHKSVDSLSPIASTGPPRADFAFHRRASHSPHRAAQRRGSTASSLHSIGGSLDTSSAHTVFEFGQNAISTLLQPPIVRTGLLPHTSAPASSAHKPPTARDIPPVTLTNITQVDTAEFKPYLDQVGALYEQLRRAKETEDESSVLPDRRGSRPDEGLDFADDGRLKPGKRPGPSRKSSVSSVASLEALGSSRRNSSSFSGRRVTAHGPPPLSTIPNVYFDEDFHLENPRTFDIVSERSEVARPATGTPDEKAAANGSAGAPRKALATNAILQEKLSWYMDTIEMHLIQSISTASTTFFTALGALRELHSEASDSVEKIKTLRRELQTLDEEIATSGLNIVQQRRRRENLRQLHDAVQQLRDIVASLATCESLVDAGETDKALDAIDALDSLISGERDVPRDGPGKIQLRDLRGTTALQGISEDLETLRARVGKAFEAKLVEVLMGDIRHHTENVSSQEVLLRWGSAYMRARGIHAREPSAFPSYMAGAEALRTDLLPILTGLKRARHLAAATGAFREAALRYIRNRIRKPMPSSTDDDNESLMSTSTLAGKRHPSAQEKSSVLARNLRALDPQDAEVLLVDIYVGVAETMRRLSTQAKILLDVASSVGDDPSSPSGLRSPPIKSPSISPTLRNQSMDGLEAQEEIHKALDLSNLLGQAVDVSQDKIVKLLRVRSQQSTQLELAWFLRYFTLNLYFANECEAISGRSGTTLKTVVNGHIKEFVQQHGDAEKQRLAQGMESDQWDAWDFSDSDKRLLDEILGSSTKDPITWSEGAQIWIPPTQADSDEGGGAKAAGQANGTGKGKTRSAVMESESFALPHSAVLCMNGMAQFLHLIAGLQSTTMTSDVSTSLISYLQLFNSRCTQLILGAGATRSAGLKNITAKHLALASQALAFVATLVPHVREFVRRHCGSGTAASPLMGEFDKVRRLYQEHQNNIYDKLVGIMKGRALAATRKMEAVEWDKNGTGTHDYMDTLIRETTMLHRSLTKHLPENTVRLIMSPVFESYKEIFGGALRGIETQTEAGRASMLRDIQQFESRLGTIDGFGDAAEHLSSIARSKEIKGAPATEPEPEPEPEPAVTSNGGETVSDDARSPSAKDSDGGTPQAVGRPDAEDKTL